jgi:hypothetical protein
VVSDWGATHDSASDNANAGLDMEQPGDNIVIGGGVFGEGGSGLASAVNGGSVTIAVSHAHSLNRCRCSEREIQWQRLNQMASRVLAGYYRLGQDSVCVLPLIFLFISILFKNFAAAGLPVRELRRTALGRQRLPKPPC